MPEITYKITGLQLSAQELRQLTDWPDPIIEAWLSLVDDLITVVEGLDIQIDNDIQKLVYSLPVVKEYSKQINELKSQIQSLPSPIGYDKRLRELESLISLFTIREPFKYKLPQNVWKDINLGAAQVLSPSASYPDIDEFKDSTGTDIGVETLAFAVGEGISGAFELQHDYKEGSDFQFHIHFQGIDAPTGTDYVRWQFDYTLSEEGVPLAPMTTVYAEAAFDTQYAFERANATFITGTNFKIGQQMLFKIARIASVGDAYTGDGLMSTVGLHYLGDTGGSRLIGTK